MSRFLLVLACLLSPALQAADKITLANGEWAPYLSKDLKHSGFMSHIVSEAFAAEGIEVEYVFLPWKRGFELTKSGKYDGTLIWGYNDERAKDFLYSDTVAKLGTSLFVQKGKNVDWSEMADLSAYKIGGVIGYAYGIEDLEKAGTVTITRIGSADANYKKLASGRLDIVLEDTDVGYELVTKLGLSDKITTHPKTFTKRDYSVIFPKKSPRSQELVEAFNRGLKKIIADGRYQQFQDASRAGEYKQ